MSVVTPERVLYGVCWAPGARLFPAEAECDRKNASFRPSPLAQNSLVLGADSGRSARPPLYGCWLSLTDSVASVTVMS